MKVRALIADDEPLARAGLREMLAAVSWIAVAGEAAHGPATVEAIDALRPDLVFLDIEMPGLRGLDVLRQIRHQPFVVFTTAYAEHAVTAFELGALDYLLKPFGPERLAATLERVRGAIGEPAPAPAVDRLSDALRHGPISRLFVRSGNAIIPVAVDSVTRFEADGDYVVAHVGKARHLLHVSLNRLESRLDAERFARVHRAHLVNLRFVRAFRRHGKGRMVAELTDGAEVPVSRPRAQELRGQGL